MAWNETGVYYRPKPYFSIDGDALRLCNVPVPKERRPQDDMGDWVCSFPYLEEHPGDPYAIYRYPDREHWQLMRRLLEHFLALVGNKPVFLVPLPMFDHYLETAPPEYLQRFRELEDPGSNRWVVDVLPRFLERPVSEREPFRFNGDPHYTAEAHRVVADVIYDELLAQIPQLLH